MCDYSLHGLTNRLAVDGEDLVTRRFPNGSVGLASPLDIAAASGRRAEVLRRSRWGALRRWLGPRLNARQVPAVCIAPGARLRMTQVPEKMQRKFDIGAVEDMT